MSCYSANTPGILSVLAYLPELKTVQNLCNLSQSRFNRAAQNAFDRAKKLAPPAPEAYGNWWNNLQDILWFIDHYKITMYSSEIDFTFSFLMPWGATQGSTGFVVLLLQSLASWMLSHGYIAPLPLTQHFAVDNIFYIAGIPFTIKSVYSQRR